MFAIIIKRSYKKLNPMKYLSGPKRGSVCLDDPKVVSNGLSIPK